MKYECFERRSWVGISIPKAACTSLRCWFRSIAEGRDYRCYPHGQKIHEWYKVTKSRLSATEVGAKPFSFALVRHPGSRVLSAYQSKISKRSNPLFYRPEFPSLESWLESLVIALRSGESPGGWNEHWRPQVLFVPDTVEFVARLESFDEDLAAIGDRLSLPLPTWQNPMHRRTPRRALSDEAMGLTMEIYRADFDRFYPGQR